MRSKYQVSIDPLEGKYYGTVLKIKNLFLDDPQCSEEWKLKLWNHGTPSNRQLEVWEMTLEEAYENDMTADGHYESQSTYELARDLKSMLEYIEI